ncbi:hypothetical protein B7L70_01245 [Vulcanisaeta sp. EB80]|uniref:hypothetical protein n=1 Tax=Vulcanisaeta sp. EB80 TaxID=1650660 RepID=UPI0009BF62C7|nr:hypothetical protein [Vulcanisaeta sp. EB80]PLC68868.1 hypothetical protein B7L70_01245 [Vulcanisaeta sp. EB80]
MARRPPWITNYLDIMDRLRLVLYKFEIGDIDFDLFIDEINKALVNCGYDPVKVLVSDTMTELFGAYSVYMPYKFASRIYVSTELMAKPRTLLGRVVMHEVFHHVLYQRPPTPLFRLAPKRNELLFFITLPLIILAVFIAFSNSFLPYAVLASSASMVVITALLIRALNSHELIATALVVYLVTGRWVKDWTYYQDDNALMNLRWSDNVKPREITIM